MITQIIGESLLVASHSRGTVTSWNGLLGPPHENGHDSLVWALLCSLEPDITLRYFIGGYRTYHTIPHPCVAPWLQLALGVWALWTLADSTM